MVVVAVGVGVSVEVMIEFLGLHFLLTDRMQPAFSVHTHSHLP